MKTYGELTALQITNIDSEYMDIELEFNEELIEQQWHLPPITGVDCRLAFAMMAESMPPDAFLCVLIQLSVQKSGPKITLLEDGVAMEAFTDAKKLLTLSMLKIGKVASPLRGIYGESIDRKLMLSILLNGFENGKWLEGGTVEPYEVPQEHVNTFLYDSQALSKNPAQSIREGLDATLNVASIYGTELNKFATKLYDINEALKTNVAKADGDVYEIERLLKDAIDAIKAVDMPTLDKSLVIGNMKWELDEKSRNVFVKKAGLRPPKLTLSRKGELIELVDVLHSICEGQYDDPVSQPVYPSTDQDPEFWELILKADSYDTYVDLVTYPAYSGLEIEEHFNKCLNGVSVSIATILGNIKISK